MGTKRKEKQESEEIVLMEDSNWFNKGSIVEVCLEDEGFRGSWYTATVLRSVSRRSNKVLLEFHTLMSDSKPTSKPLRQFVDVILVRPVPPRESNRGFFVDEEVDAFHNDGWWEGVVTDAYQVGVRESRLSLPRRTSGCIESGFMGTGSRRFNNHHHRLASQGLLLSSQLNCPSTFGMVVKSLDISCATM
ncbi:hypothetical protein Leryth_004871 [Lithospermum erythrorhizon]|nr:hypothetical protein Leryth_004871 [Lithospermum erythrorhizon]